MAIADDSLPAAAPQSPMPDLARPEKRIAAFDGMRGIAVLLVMVGHAGFHFNGSIGVDIFFVLSGYLITSILLDELAKTGHFSFKNFYMRRILRLYPALVLMVVLNLIATRILHRHQIKSELIDSSLVLTYVSNWSHILGDRPDNLAHTWSLSIEEQFYVLWPIMALGVYWLLGRTRKAALLCLAAAIGIWWYRHWMEHLPLPTGDPTVVKFHRYYRIYFGLDTRGDDLLAGAMLAFWTPKLPRLLGAAMAWAAILFLSCYLVQSVRQSFWAIHIPVPIMDVGRHPYGYVWICTVAVLIGILNDRRGWLARLLSFKPLAWVGVISYGLYLYHFPMMKQMARWHWTPWHIVAWELPLAFIVAVISFYAMERPCLRLKEHFRPGAKIPKGFPFAWRTDPAVSADPAAAAVDPEQSPTAVAIVDQPPPLR